MNETQRLMRNTGIIAIGNLSTKLVSFLLLPLYTALLSTAEYGKYDYLITIATFCVPFVSALMDESIFRYLIDCKSDGEQKQVMSTSILIVFAGMVLFTAVGTPIMLLLRYEFTVYALLYILVSSAHGMMSALLRGIGRTDQFAVYNFLTSLLQIVLNVVFVAGLHMGLVGLLLPVIIIQPLMILFFGWRLKLWKLISPRAANKALAVDMLRYSFPLIPNRLAWTIINLSSRLIIANTLGDSANGLYAVSYKFPNLMDIAYGFFCQSWKESSARVLGDKEKEAFYQSVYDNMKNLLIAITLGMTAFMPLVFRILVDEAYHEALTYVPILLISTYFVNLSSFYGGIFTAYKDTKIMGITTGVAAVINLAATLIGIRYFGLYAAAFSTLLANIIVCEYRRIKARKYMKLKENIWSTIATVLVTAGILVLFYTGKTLWIGVACGISVVYAVIINRTLLRSILKKLLWKHLN